MSDSKKKRLERMEAELRRVENASDLCQSVVSRLDAEICAVKTGRPNTRQNQPCRMKHRCGCDYGFYW